MSGSGSGNPTGDGRVSGARRRMDLRPVAAAITLVVALSGLGGVVWLTHRRVVASRSAAAAGTAAGVAAREPAPGMGGGK